MTGIEHTHTAAGDHVRWMERDEAIEVRIQMRGDRSVMVLLCWQTRYGTVGYDLHTVGSPHSEALSNLQGKVPFPGKAVQGWQAEVIAHVESGLGQIVEVR